MLATDNTGDVAVTRAKTLRRRIGALISVGIQTRALRWGLIAGKLRGTGSRGLASSLRASATSLGSNRFHGSAPASGRIML